MVCYICWFYFIQGPPGTGKSFVGVALVQLLLSMNVPQNHGPILVRYGLAACKKKRFCTYSKQPNRPFGQHPCPIHPNWVDSSEVLDDSTWCARSRSAPLEVKPSKIMIHEPSSFLKLYNKLQSIRLRYLTTRLDSHGVDTHHVTRRPTRKWSRTFLVLKTWQ